MPGTVGRVNGMTFRYLCLGRLTICGALATENVLELQNLNRILRQMMRGLVLQPSLSLPFPSLMKKEEEKNDGMCFVCEEFCIYHFVLFIIHVFYFIFD